MKLAVPFKAVKDNILLTQDNEAWAYFNIEALSISDNDEAGISKRQTQLSLLFDRLADFEDFELRLYNRDLDLVNRYKELQPSLATDMGETPVQMIVDEISAITATGVSQTIERFVLGIKLHNQNSGKVIKQATNAMNNFVDELAGWFDYEKPFDEKLFDDFRPSEKQAYEKVGYLDHTRRLTTDELVHLMRNNFIQGQLHDFRKVGHERDIFKLSDTVIDDGAVSGYVKLVNDDNVRYVAKLVLSTTPENITGFHLFRLVQNMSYPIDINLKAHYYKSEGIYGLATRASQSLKTASNNVEERYQAEGFSSSKDDKTIEIAEVLNDHISEKKNFFSTLVTFTVSAEDIEILHDRVDNLIESFKSMDVIIVKPIGEQKRLFYYDLMGSDVSQNRYWVQLLTSEGIGELLFAVNQQVGSNMGFYIGRGAPKTVANSTQDALDSSKRLVFFNPLITNEILDGSTSTTSPNIMITGKTGRGKSYLTKIILKIIQLSNAKAIYFDPKQEMRKWYSAVLNDQTFKADYPDEYTLLNNVRFVTLDVSDKTNYGVLDPFIVIDVRHTTGQTQSGEESLKATVQEIFKQIYRDYGSLIAETELDLAINKIIQKRQAGETVGMLDVIEELAQNEDEDVKHLAKFLSGKVTRSSLSLVFSHGESEGLKLNNRITILETAGLTLPQHDKAKQDYTEFEVASMIVMTVLGVFSRTFATRDYDEKTVEIFDEAWTFTTSDIGSRIFNEMARIGRSANNLLIPVTQSVYDVKSENFGVLFAFDEDKEQPDILQHVGLPVNDDNIKELGNMVMGQCFMKDIYGRVEKITVDEPLVAMQRAYQTVKAGDTAQAEKAYR
ncbi:ATP-binding protein [Leuconostoc mesenteroides]|uniref:ATP-binding protein n=1 Tax=Leuconostoc mesenteroides TaxID=1245 RepID=UPI001CBB45EE|nr:ATP-binding protein [Leuconostoc mesenteroides]MBZ1510611.1 ATP-binding protein [Leuconostoc mesenteroides]